MSKLYTGDYECSITFRCSERLQQLCKEGAAASGLDLSTYIRAALWTAAPRVLALRLPACSSGALTLQDAPSECCACCRWAASFSEFHGIRSVYCADQSKMMNAADCCDLYEKRVEK